MRPRLTRSSATPRDALNSPERVDTTLFRLASDVGIDVTDLCFGV